MKILKEYMDGFRWVNADTSSAPFEKDSDIYKEKLEEGFELVLIPQSEKDAHKIEQENAVVVSDLNTMDTSIRQIEEALAGDTEALALIAARVATKKELRGKLK